MSRIYPRYKVYIKKGAMDREGKRISELTGATYTWTVSAVDENDVAELGAYSGTTSWQHVYDPPLHVPCHYLVVIEEACQHFTVETVTEVEPTCTQTGRTAGKRCINCKEYLLAPDVIPALGHDFVYDVIERTRICRTCGTRNDEDRPVRIMQSDITRLMNVVEEMMLDDASTKLDTTTAIKSAARVFIQQYTYTTKDGNDSTRETESPEGEFHIYFKDTQGVRNYLVLTPVGSDVILSHGSYDVERLQSTVVGKDGLPSRFKVENGNIVGLFETGDNQTVRYQLINSTTNNMENNISIENEGVTVNNKLRLKFYSSTSPTTLVTTPVDNTEYVLAANSHSGTATGILDQLCYVTGIIVR